MVDWSLLRPTNITENALAAFKMGRSERAMTSAGQALQTGDYGGAQNALYGAGMIDQGLALGQEQQQQQRQAMQDQRAQVVQGRQDEQYAAAQKAELAGQALNIAKSLRVMPQEQRGPVYAQQGVPVLQQLGVPDAEIQRVLADGLLTDQELDGFIVQFGGVLEGPEPVRQQLVNSGGYVGAFNPETGDLTDLREDPLQEEYLRARISATRAQEGQRERSNRGGGGGSNTTGLPPGFVLD